MIRVLLVLMVFFIMLVIANPDYSLAEILVRNAQI